MPRRLERRQKPGPPLTARVQKGGLVNLRAPRRHAHFATTCTFTQRRSDGAAHALSLSLSHRGHKASSARCRACSRARTMHVGRIRGLGLQGMQCALLRQTEHVATSVTRAVARSRCTVLHTGEDGDGDSGQAETDRVVPYL